jgi:hypothetical protein
VGGHSDPGSDGIDLPPMVKSQTREAVSHTSPKDSSRSASRFKPVSTSAKEEKLLTDAERVPSSSEDAAEMPGGRAGMRGTAVMPS